MKYAQKPAPPAHRAAGRIHPLLPVVIHVAIALPALRRSRLAHKSPQLPQQKGTRADRAPGLRLLAPPVAERGPKLLEKIRRHACMLANPQEQTYQLVW